MTRIFFGQIIITVARHTFSCSLTSAFTNLLHNLPTLLLLTNHCNADAIDVQIKELKNTLKSTKLGIGEYMKREKELDLKLKQMKTSFNSVCNERNILSKNLHTANVIMPFYY